MKLEILSINKQGVTHDRLEDAIYKNDEDFVYGVFDGVSASKYGAEAAKALAEDMGSFLHDEKFRKAVLTFPVQEVRNAVVEAIQHSFNRIKKEYNCELRDAACTMVLAILDPESRSATILHCGDGAVFALSETYQKASISVISHPDNSESGAVYAAQDANQIMRMRVTRVSLETLGGIILCTDGFSSAYFDPMQEIFESYDLMDAFRCSSNEELRQLVQRRHIDEGGIGDDISAIIIKIDNQIDYNNLKDEVVSLKSKQQNLADESDSKEAGPENCRKAASVKENEKKPFADINNNSSDDSDSINDYEKLPVNERGNNSEESIDSYEAEKSASKIMKANLFLTVVLAIIVIIAMVFAYFSITDYRKEKTESAKSISVLQGSASQLLEENSSLNERIAALEENAGIKEEESQPQETTEESTQDNNEQNPESFFDDGE